MKALVIVVFFVLKLLCIYCSQPERIADQMYINFDRIRYCVRHFNATHEIGCQSSASGNSGRMYMIDDDEEFNAYLNNRKLIDSSQSFIIFLNVNLFTSDYVDKLMTNLGSKLNGLLLYLKSNLTRPEYFSHDDQCPNNRNSYHLNQTEITNWNPKGTGLYFRSFPFPIMLIDEENDYKRIVQFYAKFNSDHSSLICGLELNMFQNGAHSSKTCMRRNQISHSLLDSQETLCDPVGGLNIYSKLSQPLTAVSKQRQPKSVILILAATDGFQMFLKTGGKTGGSQQPATALLTFLTFAHLIGQVQEELNQQDKEIIFVTLDGDALDYSASYRFMYDLEHGNFPTDNKNEEPINIEHIHSVIEFQSLGLTDQLSLYAYPASLINETFIHELVDNNKMIVPMTNKSSMPPASSQIFLRQTSSSSFPVYLLTAIRENQFENRYYHSFFDDPSTLAINMSSLEYNSTTNFSIWIKDTVEPFVKTVIESFTGVRNNVTIEQEIVNNLVYCVLKNINCPLIHNVTNSSIGDTFDPFNETSLPFSVNTYPVSATPTFPFVQNILSYFLRDRRYDTYNLTESECNNYANNDSLHSYTYVSGYPPSIKSETSFVGYCVRSYIQTASSISPAFFIKDYDLSNTMYPAWTESRWGTASLRLFVLPTRKHEVVTLVIGILLLAGSFILCLILRYFTKISLLQPSAS